MAWRFPGKTMKIITETTSEDDKIVQDIVDPINMEHVDDPDWIPITAELYLAARFRDVLNSYVSSHKFRQIETLKDKLTSLPQSSIDIIKVAVDAEAAKVP